MARCAYRMDVETTIWTVEIGTEAILLGALVKRGLASRYFAFTVYVAFDAISDIGLTFFGRGRSYAIAWMVASSVAVFLRIAVTLELFRRICDHYPGIGRFGKTLVLVLAVGVVLGTVATVSPDLHAIDWQRPLLHSIVLFRRLTSTGLTLFLVVTASFFARFPTPLSRNIVIHGRLLALYFFVNACSDMTFILKGIGSARVVSEVLLSAVALCFLAWTFLLTKSGETVPELTRVSDQDAQRVERWNKELLQAGRWLVG